jgi:integrase
MAFIYKRHNRYWYRVKEGGKWVSRKTEFLVESTHGQRNAKRVAEAKQRQIDASARGETVKMDTGVLTVRNYALSTWIPERKATGHDWKSDLGKLKKNILPKLGDLVLADVRAPALVALVKWLRFERTPKMAARTLRNNYTIACSLFRDATLGGLIESSPCILTDEQLGPVVDADPEWRAGAYYTREEVHDLIDHLAIPFDRRVVYALGCLAGLRPGEGAALRWRHWEPSVTPLGRLTVAKSYSTKRDEVKGTKTEVVKIIPVHPALASLLAEWKLSGWAAMMGRAPTDDDLIIPLPPATVAKRTKRTGEPHRGYDYSSKRWREVDLVMLGWRERSLYDMRATFITLACDEDGANRDIIKTRVTHAKPTRDAFDGYARGTRWAETCAEVSKLSVGRGRHRVTGRVTVADFAKDSSLISGSGGGSRTPDPAVNSRLLYH